MVRTATCEAAVLHKRSSREKMANLIESGAIAAMLHEAEQKRRAPLAPLSEVYPGLTIEQAYAIQRAWLEIKHKEHVQLIGHKIGLTSLAMQQQLGVDQPDYGFLLNTMVVPAGSVLAYSDFIAPRIEPEIGFWLAKDVRGPGVTAAEVMAATRGVCAALELVDSRIANWRIKLVDTIADNASSARVVISDYVVPPADLDLVAEGVTLYRNDEAIGMGNGAAVLGHPAAAVAWLANKLADFGIALLAGQFVLPGAMCAAASAKAGESYRAAFTHLGDVSVSFA
jgi:2-keto-4-pentenoate hydratase